MILPAASRPSIEYCARWAQGPCVVDGGEHFVKRSERNRTHILTAGGVLTLTVQAVRANRPRTPMRDVRIDYSKRWQHQHWTALVSAYKASPYFDHYAPRFEPVYTRRYEFLFDYDLRLMETIAELLGLPMPAVSEAYLTADEGDLDLRPKRKEGADFASPPYIQVFSAPLSATLSRSSPQRASMRFSPGSSLQSARNCPSAYFVSATLSPLTSSTGSSPDE